MFEVISRSNHCSAAHSELLLWEMHSKPTSSSQRHPSAWSRHTDTLPVLPGSLYPRRVLHHDRCHPSALSRGHQVGQQARWAGSFPASSAPGCPKSHSTASCGQHNGGLQRAALPCSWLASPGTGCHIGNGIFTALTSLSHPL